MSYPRLATRLYNTALMLTPSKAEVIEKVFRAHEEGRASLLSPPLAAEARGDLAAPGVVRTDAGYYRTADGIALIPVIGTLVQRGDSLDAASGLTGYNRIAGQLQAAIDDPRVNAVLLEIDSPGGEANGAFDLAAKIRAANTVKPVWASANEQAFSAAYLIASAAERIAVPESGMVGSIGVVMMHVDQSAKDAKAGVTYTPIFAGDRKVDFSPHAPLSDAALTLAQEEVNRVYDLFVNAVVSGRGIDAAAVKKTQANLLHPQAALDAGLIDAVQSFDATMADLVAEVQSIRTHGRRATATVLQPPGANDMSEQKPNTGAPATSEAAAPTAAQLAAAQAQGVEEGAAVGTKAGVDAERARIAGIIGHPEASGRRQLAEHIAFKTSSSIEDAIAMLAAAPKEAAASANPLAAAMARTPNPAVGVGNGETRPEGENRLSASNIYDMRAKAVANAGK